jgi:hypothetical protein
VFLEPGSNLACGSAYVRISNPQDSYRRSHSDAGVLDKKAEASKRELPVWPAISFLNSDHLMSACAPARAKGSGPT